MNSYHELMQRLKRLQERIDSLSERNERIQREYQGKKNKHFQFTRQSQKIDKNRGQQRVCSRLRSCGVTTHPRRSNVECQTDNRVFNVDFAALDISDPEFDDWVDRIVCKITQDHAGWLFSKFLHVYVLFNESKKSESRAFLKLVCIESMTFRLCAINKTYSHCQCTHNFLDQRIWHVWSPKHRYRHNNRILIPKQLAVHRWWQSFVCLCNAMEQKDGIKWDKRSKSVYNFPLNITTDFDPVYNSALQTRISHNQILHKIIMHPM